MKAELQHTLKLCNSAILKKNNSSTKINNSVSINFIEIQTKILLKCHLTKFQFINN